MKMLSTFFVITVLFASCSRMPLAIPGRVPSNIPSPSGTPTLFIAGDMGWGNVSGFVSDGINGAPIAGAIVTCKHSSYTSTATCDRSTTTDANGYFLFEDIFFHDTDRLTLRVVANDYNPQYYEWDSFNWPMVYVDVSMLPINVTYALMCTPPQCAIGTNEVYFCAGECPNGCGTTCATYTPTIPVAATATPLSFPCLDCDLGPALEYLCPQASATDETMKLLRPFGEVQRGRVGDHDCLYVPLIQENWGYVYYVEEGTVEVKFVVINPFVLTPSSTVNPSTPTPVTPLPFYTATDTPNQ